ncbi:hypothetical protein [Haloquadratum walsbyi]|uniref:Uncharacterized protein n=1 Tax=Haloquadratum walsbyi (strain DSM 16854 / JCM 12705 / C23) TaxID=768065 RepID=G0LL91_HALWC|nr:hypothetical protein [Haloquadratum walsbyi]CCC40531.1 uncharacterized protein Hqrw_2699 [Haloquadratum walsbyi C23]
MTPRLVKTLALAVVIAAIIASSGLVSALDASSPSLSGTASASAASTPAPNTGGNPQAVMIEPAGDAPGALTAQNTLRDGAITRVDITPPQAIPTQPNPSQPVFTITNTDTQTVTVWITHEDTNVDTKTETDANAGSTDLQYRDAETGERLSGTDVTVTLEPGEERVVGVVADDSASASISGTGAGTEATSSTITATAHVHIRQTG